MACWVHQNEQIPNGVKPIGGSMKTSVQKTYEVGGKEYRFTEVFRGYIRLEINKILQPQIDFCSWTQVENYIKTLSN